MTKNTEQKLIDLEMSLGLLQRDYEKQNEMLLQNTRLIQQMELNIKRLTDQLASLQASAGGNERLLKDEKPPHY